MYCLTENNVLYTFASFLPRFGHLASQQGASSSTILDLVIYGRSFGHIWPIVLKRLEPVIKVNKFHYFCLFFATIEDLWLKMVFFSKIFKVSALFNPLRTISLSKICIFQKMLTKFKTLIPSKQKWNRSWFLYCLVEKVFSSHLHHH